MPHVTLVAEQITTILGFSVTNSMIATWLVMLLLFIFTWLATHKLSLIPNGAQTLAEIVVGGLHDFYEQIAGENVKRFFPIAGTLFLFIVVSNWMGLLPGFGTIGITKTEEIVTHEASAAPAKTAVKETAPADDQAPIADEHKEESATSMVATEAVPGGGQKEHSEFVPLLRAATADLNMTIALALIAVFAIQYFGYSMLGFHYTGRFIILTDPVMFGVGLLELVSEISKIISFGFRLFGNIFAGEVLLTVIAFLIPFIAPMPFIAMELFVGMIQALVFSMLFVIFAQVAVSHGEHHE